jgi:hypothetical protein
MTTSATSLLGLALPVTGELSGTWGDVVNSSITALVDSAIAGATTLSTDADVTLTTTTLAANQARQAIILWTAGGTATRYITAPAQSKTYVVINKTSSTQSIVIRGVGPTTGVTVLAGQTTVVAWNGTDFVATSGNVVGAASSTDNAIVRFDGTTGKSIQNSVATVSDDGTLSTAKIRQTAGEIGIGTDAGLTDQDINAVAIGHFAGQTTQGENAVAIGNEAGRASQGRNGIAIGTQAAGLGQGISSVVIGNQAGYNVVGNYSIAIGYRASYSAVGTATNVIILNATGSDQSGTVSQSNSFYVAPIRTDSTAIANSLRYNTSTYEITYTDTIGYGTGSGGTVTQLTSRTTGVTLNKLSGAITLVSAAGTTTATTFTVTNSTVTAADTIIVNQKSGTNLYITAVTSVAAGSFKITFYTTGGTTTEAPVFNFNVIRGSTG